MGFPEGLEKVFTHEPESLDDDEPKIDEPQAGFPWAESMLDELKPEDDVDDSPSRLEWLRQKREDNEENPYIDQLMSMVGLEDVKAHFLAIKSMVKGKDAKDRDPEKLRLHLVLHGKGGTGEYLEAYSNSHDPLMLILCDRQENYCKPLCTVLTFPRTCR